MRSDLKNLSGNVSLCLGLFRKSGRGKGGSCSYYCCDNRSGSNSAVLQVSVLFVHDSCLNDTNMSFHLEQLIVNFID